jgi:hypothetical protein
MHFAEALVHGSALTTSDCRLIAAVLTCLSDGMETQSFAKPSESSDDTAETFLRCGQEAAQTVRLVRDSANCPTRHSYRKAACSRRKVAEAKENIQVQCNTTASWECPETGPECRGKAVTTRPARNALGPFGLSQSVHAHRPLQALALHEWPSPLISIRV